MYQLKFTLQQHTPIIHFQHDQEGATLRATEVKPKLDRYIVQQWAKKETGTEEEIQKKLFIIYGHLTTGFTKQKWDDEVKMYKGKNDMQQKEYLSNFKWSLDYKVKITSVGGKIIEPFDEIEIDKRTGREKMSMEGNQPKRDNYGEIIYKREGFPSFFGNIDKAYERKEIVFDEGDIEVNITTFKSDLKKLITEHFSNFLLITNFGSRQSKGFGSFTEKELNIDKQKNKYYYFSVQLNNDLPDFYTHLFKRIDWLYKTLRSGLNVKGSGKSDKFYFKSLMFHYAKSKNQQWDKKTIRSNFFIEHPAYKHIESITFNEDGTFLYSNPNNKHLFRDLMGLSSREEWQEYKATVEKKGVTLEDNQPVIQRFSSPITLKPIKTSNEKGKTTYIVFLIPHLISATYLKESFDISSTTNSLRLKVWDNFSVTEYFKFCFNEFFVEDGIFSDEAFYENTSQPDNIRYDCDEYIFLKNAFRELSKQKPTQV